jgi:hypothetical protein
MKDSHTQRGKIIELLKAADGGWVSLPEIMACAAQYNARIFELRRLGFRIENRTKEIGGARHSWFRLVTEPKRATLNVKLDLLSVVCKEMQPSPSGMTGSLFGDLSRDRSYSE